MRAGCSLRPSPTRNRRRVVASIVIALLAAAWSACTDSPSTPLRPTASPPPNPTTLSGITLSDAEPMVVEGESATIVITLDSDPGQDIEVQLRLGRTGADDVAFAPDRVAWTTTNWQQPRELAITAVVDEVRERLEPHELQVWTYRRGQTGPGQQILAKETIQVWIAERRQVRAFAGGGEGEILLAWTNWDEPGTQRWQYRFLGAVWQGVQYRQEGSKLVEVSEGWGDWQDIPGSTAATRSHRVVGLLPEFGHEFQLRPWTAMGAGTVSEIVDSVAPRAGPDGIPVAPAGVLLEPGRMFRFWIADYSFVVPVGMLLALNSNAVMLHDMTTGARAVIDPDTGELYLESARDAKTGLYSLVYRGTGEAFKWASWKGVAPPPGYDQSALFDQIASSIRREPPLP